MEEPKRKRGRPAKTPEQRQRELDGGSDWRKEVEAFGDGFMRWRARIKRERGFDPAGFFEDILRGKYLVNAESLAGDGEVGIVPFVPRNLQRMWFREIIRHRWAATDPEYAKTTGKPAPTGRFNRLVIKYRRAGFSTGHCQFLNADGTVNRGCNAIVTAHTGDGLDNLSEILRTALGRSKKSDVKAKGMASRRMETSSDSVIRLLGPNDSLGRGGGFMHLQWSEADYVEDIESALNSVLPSMNKSPFATVVLESTMRMDAATGFKDFVERSLRGETSYVVYFQGWLDDETARIEPTPEERAAIEAGETEKGAKGYDLKLLERGASIQQVAWWRQRFREDARNSLAAMLEMYPTTIEEAMQTSGGVEFFTQGAIKAIKEATRDPARKFFLHYDGMREATEQDDWRGQNHLAVWEEPRFGGRYVIGADGADASQRIDEERGSESYLVVLDYERGVVCAEWHGYSNTPEFAIAIKSAAMYYNRALVVPEANASSGVIDNLMNNLQYQNVYERESFGATRFRQPGVYGFATTAQSRPILVQRLQDNINRKVLWIPSETLLKQLIEFGKRKGRPQKKQSKPGEIPDDGCIALGLCMFGHENAINGVWQPKLAEDYLETLERVDITQKERAKSARAGTIIVQVDEEDHNRRLSRANARRWMNRS